MEQIITVQDIPLCFDMPKLIKDLELEGKPSFIRRLEKLAARAIDVARPKAVARLSNLKALDEARMSVDQVVFTSTLMVKNMAGLGRAFPFLVTEGRELYEWGLGLESHFDIVMSASLRELAPLQYQELLEQKLLETFGMHQISLMSPGSLTVWPIEQQKELFELLSPLPANAGVELLPSFMMKPEYSISGVFFETEKKYHNCQFCPRLECPQRQTAYLGVSA